MPRRSQLRRPRKRPPRSNCPLHVEQLESRLLLASDWRNPVDALDVNGDQHVTPIDALWVANDLHRNGSRELPVDRGGPTPPFLDVNGDGFVAPSDAIRVIDALNAGQHSPYVLDERAGRVATTITIGLGQEYGPRLYTFGIEADFDNSGGVAGDRVEVYLVDPRNPDQTLLDGGEPGTPVFVLEPGVSSYSDENVRYDGSQVQLSLGSLGHLFEGELQFRLVGGNNVAGSRVSLRPLSNELLPGLLIKEFPSLPAPADGTQTVILDAEFIRGSGRFDEIGLVMLDDATSAVGGVAPDDPAYEDAIRNSPNRFAIATYQDSPRAQRQLSFPLDAPIAIYALHSDPWLGSVADHLQVSEIALGAWEVGWDESPSSSDGLSSSSNGDFDDALVRVVARRNRPVTTDPDVQLNPSLAVSPLDPDHVVIAYMDWSLVDTGYAGISVAVSHDGGTTWERKSIPVPEPYNEGAANPLVRFDDLGRVFVAYQAATFLGPKPGMTTPGQELVDGVNSHIWGFQSNNGVFVVRSDDGGKTWNQPTAVVSRIYQGQEVPYTEHNMGMGIDTSPLLPTGLPNPNYGNIYVVWLDLYPPGQFPGHPEYTGSGDIFIAVSADSGLTWEIKLQESQSWIDANGDGIRQQEEVTTVDITVLEHLEVDFGPAFVGVVFPHVTIGPEGDVYVANLYGGDFSVSHSSDGASSFAHPDHGTGDRLAFGTGFNTFAIRALSSPRFIAFPDRDVAADPTRPGRVYAVTTINTVGEAGGTIDGGDIFFASSPDYGRTWGRSFVVGTTTTELLNDDNDGQRATGLTEDEVISGQGFTEIGVDNLGNIVVIWADQRRDPDNKLVDVFGTVSMDGGRTFSPNFRITDTSFDPDTGSFIDARGEEEFYLGHNMASVNVAHDYAYVGWTDTRAGNRGIHFSRFGVKSSPAGPNDRLEPNNTSASATSLRRTAARALHKLVLAAGDEDWYLVEAAATGNLSVSIAQVEPGDHLRLELWNRDATKLLETGTDFLHLDGQVAGQRVLSPTKTGEEFLVRLVAKGGTGTGYSMSLESFTEDLGTQVHGVRNRFMEEGEEFLYRLTTGAPGSLDVELTASIDAQGDQRLELLDPEDLSVLASGMVDEGLGNSHKKKTSLSVERYQELLIRVSGAVRSMGEFELEFTNLDQFTTLENKTLRFSAGRGPGQIVQADLNSDNSPDLVVSDATADTINVLLSNGDGTFQAPAQFAVGAFVTPTESLRELPTLARAVTVADFNLDGSPDIVSTNYASGDVSLLLGRGNGSFETQRRFNATQAPAAVKAGDLNDDEIPDLVVADLTGSGSVTVAVLLSRGDGTFQPQRVFSVTETVPFLMPGLGIADFDNDGVADLAISVPGLPRNEDVRIFIGNGDGTFKTGSGFRSSRIAFSITAADLNEDGNPDLVVPSFNDFGPKRINVHLGKGDGSFIELLNPATKEPGFPAGRTPVAAAVVDFGSDLADSPNVLGPRDGYPDIVVAASGVNAGGVPLGPPELVVLPSQFENGKLIGFGLPRRIATAKLPQSLDVGDFNNDGALDVAVVDLDAALIIYAEQPNALQDSLLATTRNLGTVVHYVDQTQTIVPGHEDAFFRLTVPTEAVQGAGDQVIDFSGRFEATSGAGISMRVLDADGNVLGSGERFRVRAAQGQELTLHVFGVADSDGVRGSGAYTLVIDVLPQVVSAEAQALLPGASERPGGPTTSIVLTLQGDRLDRVTAEDADNYTVHHAGLDGTLGTSDDASIPIDGIVYSPSTNVDVSTGKILPTAVRQTVTLDFADPLPAGSYSIDLTAGIQTEPFNEQEAGLLTPRAGFNGHPVVTLNTESGQITEGSHVEAVDLVLPSGDLGSFTAFGQGTPFLSQLHADMGALLDAILTERGDDPRITNVLTNQMLGSLNPALGQFGQRPTGLLGIWLDPVSMDLTDPNGDHIAYDLKNDTLIVDRDDCFVLVIWNIELIICPVFGGEFRLDVADVPETARGGVVKLQQDGNETTSLTEELRAGVTGFTIQF